MVIAEDAGHRHRISEALQMLFGGDRHPEVRDAASTEDAIARITADDEWIIVCDCGGPAGDRARGVPRLTALNAGPVIVMTEDGDESFVRDVYELGASGYLLHDEILGSGPHRTRARRTIDQARRHWGLDRYARELTRSLEQANSELRRRNQRLRVIAQSTQRFMDDVAHDLRGPLASIGCYADMLAQGIYGPMSEKQIPQLELIQTTAADLHATVNDFLDSSRIRTGTIIVDRRPIDVRAKLDAVATLLRPQAAQRGIRLETDDASALPPAFGDPVRVRRVLENLLANAIQHGPERGTIRLAGERDGDWIRLSVIDTGPGIPPVTAERILDRFRRGASEGRASDGLGLGLAIALDFARASLGRLELETDSGTGSTFTFVLPVAEDGPVRRAAERRWHEDEEARVLWIDVHHVPDEEVAVVRAWLAARLGTTGIVLPGHRDDRLRVGRPGDDVGEWIAILERDRAAAPSGSPVSRIRFHAAAAHDDGDADSDRTPEPLVEILDRSDHLRDGVSLPPPHGR
jgi:signal transduction histidine kinase